MGRNNPKEFVFVPQQRHMLYSKLNTDLGCRTRLGGASPDRVLAIPPDRRLCKRLL